MSTIAEVAEALASTIANATGLRSFAYVADDLNPPACVVTVAFIDPATFEIGSVDPVFQVIVFVSKATDRGGQTQMYDYMGPTGTKSVWAAIHATPGLGIANESIASVRSIRALGIEEVAAYGYYGALFEVPIILDA